MLYEKQNMQRDHYSNALKFTDYYSVWAYCIFIRKFAAATKD